MSYTLIDPPITPYSSTKDINKWIDELKEMEQNEQVKEAIKYAENLLTVGENNDSSINK